MDFHVINTSRGRANRTLRAQQPSRVRYKQYLGSEQLRSVRCRPLVVSAEWVEKNLEELKKKSAIGAIEVRTPDGRLVDLSTLEAAPAPAEVPQPNPPLDSAANDENRGRFYPKFADGATIGEAIEHREEVDARAEAEAEEMADAEEEEVEYVEQPAQTQSKKNKRGR
jgi:hypothetical protein